MFLVDLQRLLVSGVLMPGQLFLLDSVRFASKKAGGSSKNVGGKSPGRRYGFKKQDGMLRLLEIPLCKSCKFSTVSSCICSFLSGFLIHVIHFNTAMSI